MTSSGSNGWIKQKFKGEFFLLLLPWTPLVLGLLSFCCCQMALLCCHTSDKCCAEGNIENSLALCPQCQTPISDVLHQMTNYFINVRFTSLRKLTKQLTAHVHVFRLCMWRCFLISGQTFSPELKAPLQQLSHFTLLLFTAPQLPCSASTKLCHGQ